MDPVIAIIIDRDVLRFKSFYIRERQFGQCSEHENISDYIQPLQGECLVHYCMEFILGKELTVCSLGMKTYPLEWIHVHPFVVECERDDPFQNLAVFVSRVLFQLLVNSKKEMKVSHESIVDSRERDV